MGRVSRPPPFMKPKCWTKCSAIWMAKDVSTLVDVLYLSPVAKRHNISTHVDTPVAIGAADNLFHTVSVMWGAVPENVPIGAGGRPERCTTCICVCIYMHAYTCTEINTHKFECM